MFFCKVRGILNKLTPQKFQTLTQQIIDLDMDTPERLEGCVDLIFEQVINYVDVKKKIGLTKDFKYLGTVTHSLPVTQRGSQASFHPLITWIYPNVKCRMDWFYRKSYTCLLGLSAGTGKLCIFGHLGLVFIWSCFVSCLLLLLYYVICAPVLTEGTCLLFNFQFVKKILPIEHV